MRSSRGRRTAIPAGFVMDYVVDVTSDRTGSYNNELAFEPPSDKGNYFFQSNRDRRAYSTQISPIANPSIAPGYTQWILQAYSTQISPIANPSIAPGYTQWILFPVVGGFRRRERNKIIGKSLPTQIKKISHTISCTSYHFSGSSPPG
ncbi:hypothetical protein QE152_g11167 [Popillia japonica]|uniref:Uncharacterized protein n=1 Tax=Popillia japonica TaxID=7064 RepID=A0AAW1LSE3_POPJA